MASSNPFLPLAWSIDQAEQNKCHVASCDCTDETFLPEVIEVAAIKAIELLDHNLRDNSMYLLFEWSPNARELQVALTDASKTQDAPEIVKLSLTKVTATDELRELIKFSLHDFLCSYPGFLRYSLVAAFHSTNRKNTELL